MQTIKGLITLFLVAVSVFTVVYIFNKRTEPAYEVKMEKITQANTDKTAQPTVGKTSSRNAHAKTKKSSL